MGIVYDITNCRIFYKNKTRDELNNLELYTIDFPRITDYSNYKTIAMLEVECDLDFQMRKEDIINDDQKEIKRINGIINAMKKYFKEKNITFDNIFTKFRINPYKNFNIINDDELFSILKTVFPEHWYKIQFYEFEVKSNGGFFKISHRKIYNVLRKHFSDTESLLNFISISWIEENYYKGFLLENFKSSLYEFLSFIFDSKDSTKKLEKWDIVNLPDSEFTDSDRKRMIVTIVQLMDLNSTVINYFENKTFTNIKIVKSY
jgi:hypothetical protein